MNFRKYTAIIYIFLLLIIFLPLPLFAQQQRGEDAKFQELRKKFEEGWRKLKEIDESNRQYSVKRYIRSSPKAKLKMDSSGKVKVSPGNYMDSLRYSGKGEALFAKNPSYAFLISRKENEPGWVLGSFDEGTDIKTNRPLQFAFMPTNINYSYPLSPVLGRFPEGWLNDLGISITKVAKDKTGHYLVQYRRRGLRGIKEKEPFELIETLTVDPDMHWCVLELTQQKPGGNIHYRFQREVEWVGSHLVCKKITQTDPKGESLIWEFDDYSFDNNYSPDIFYLSHYGLPEPIDVVPPRAGQPWYLWFGIAAVALFVGWIVFRWLARRGNVRKIDCILTGRIEKNSE